MPAKKTAAAAETETKETVKKTAAKKVAVALTAENVGFKAGDVYNALNEAGVALSVEEIAQAAKITVEETLLGIGWLFKEGKIVSVEDKVALA